MREISTEARERLVKNGQFLVTKVDFETLDQLEKWIVNERPAKTEFVIAINSSGGSPSAVINFASFVGTLGRGVKLTGVAFSECGSAAIVLLQCCHERIAVKHCGFFIHHLQSNLNTTPHQVTLKRFREEVADSRDLEDEVVRLQCARTGLSAAAWNRLANRGSLIKGRAIYPAAARKLGLIDKIVDHYPIF
jgi:ATP-dependent protease ClpP protease subunit